MKKILVLAFLTALSANSLWADDLTDSLKPTQTNKTPTPTIEEILPSNSASPANQLGPNEKWIERVEGTFGIPASSDVNSTLNLGFGGGLAIGYRLDERSSISIASGYYQYSIKTVPSVDTGAYLSYVPLEAILNYTMGDGSLRPYVSLGVGFAFNTYSQTMTASNGSSVETFDYETSFMLSPAVGILQIISPKAAIFVEGRMDMDFRANNTLGIPNGTPSIFVPVQAGLTFFLL